MILWNNHRISEKQKEVLILIYRYRALTNEHLRRIIYFNLTSKKEGQKANISRYTAGLKEMKMIKSESCYPYSKELIHFLTKKGVEFVKDQVIIDSHHSRVGVDGIHYGDFEASMLKPDIKKLNHTMMFLDFAIKHHLIFLKQKRFSVRHNLYAVKKFKTVTETEREANEKIRPDAEMEIDTVNGTFASIELDTGTERTDKLVEKFSRYRNYFDFCIDQDLEPPWSALVFVCHRTTKEYQKDKRLHTIIRAAVEGLQHYCWTIDVIILRNESPRYLKHFLTEEAELLAQLDIRIPSEENPAVLEKERKEREKAQKEIERNAARESAERALQKQLHQERKKYEEKKKAEEIEKRLLAEEERKRKNKLFGMAKFFQK